MEAEGLTVEYEVTSEVLTRPGQVPTLPPATSPVLVSPPDTAWTRHVRNGPSGPIVTTEANETEGRVDDYRARREGVGCRA
jgi:hypothetical protein